MALEVQPPDGRRRVKVYELKDNDWFDRGTGFCTGQILGVSCRVLCAHWGLCNVSSRAIPSASPSSSVTDSFELGGASHICRIRRPTQSRPT